VKSFQAGFNNHHEKTEDCEGGTGLNQGTCCLPLDVGKDTASAGEIESDDTIIVNEEVPSTPDEVLEDTFKEMEEQNQDSHCESSDSDIVNTNNSRTLPSHQEALECVSQLTL
jgi:hypothetical protein